MNFLRPLLSRILAPFVGALAAWLAARYGGEWLDAVQALAELVVFAIATGVTHKLIDRKLNPLDAAKVPPPPPRLPR